MSIINKNRIKQDDLKFASLDVDLFKQPKYDSVNYYKDITENGYFYALLVLRHYIKLTSDYYFAEKLGAKNVDLFMLTSSVSSPLGPGSDSKALKIKFGEFKTFLVDSSQFGFEPLLLNNIDKVYCYLPSMRGEDPDSRHLNQFYHCEMEMNGFLDDLIPEIEGYVKELSKTVLLMRNIVKRISEDPERTWVFLNKIVQIDKFPSLNFDEAVDLLVKNGHKHLVNFTDYGKDISNEGEFELIKILKIDTPLWLKHFDRDRVPFYQKPLLKDKEKVINADLLFPPLTEKSFGGEVVGAGQRQDNVKEMYESLKRQGIPTNSYEWYINLRKLPKYKTTSGFGLGIERFIAWFLAKENIRDVILYPRLKNVKTYP